MKRLSIEILQKTNEILDNPIPDNVKQLETIIAQIPTPWENGMYLWGGGADAELKYLPSTSYT